MQRVYMAIRHFALLSAEAASFPFSFHQARRCLDSVAVIGKDDEHTIVGG